MKVSRKYEWEISRKQIGIAKLIKQGIYKNTFRRKDKSSLRCDGFEVTVVQSVEVSSRQSMSRRRNTAIIRYVCMGWWPENGRRSPKGRGKKKREREKTKGLRTTTPCKTSAFKRWTEERRCYKASEKNSEREKSRKSGVIINAKKKISLRRKQATE